MSGITVPIPVDVVKDLNESEKKAGEHAPSGEKPELTSTEKSSVEDNKTSPTALEKKVNATTAFADMPSTPIHEPSLRTYSASDANDLPSVPTHEPATPAENLKPTAKDFPSVPTHDPASPFKAEENEDCKNCEGCSGTEACKDKQCKNTDCKTKSRKDCKGCSNDKLCKDSECKNSGCQPKVSCSEKESGKGCRSSKNDEGCCSK